MTWPRIFDALCLSLLYAFCSPAQAQILTQTSAELVKQGKRATALVIVQSTKTTGTAFCVGTGGYFVTNEHVTEKAQGPITLLLHPGAADQKTFQARILDTDKDRDLSLLKIDGAIGLTALPLGTDNALMETDPIIAFGYPFGTALALTDDSYPAVSVSVGHITALRRDKKGLQYLQLDASLNPGNSGGPVLDATGKIVGVVEAGVPGAALNFAIPVHILETFLRRPLVVFSPPPIPRMQATQPHSFEIEVNPLFPDKVPASVILSLNTPNHPNWRSFIARRTGPSLYEVSAVPVPRVPGPRRLWVIGLNPFTQPSSKDFLSADMIDRVIAVRDHTVLLSDLDNVTFKDGRTVTVEMVDGELLPGPVTGLTSVPVYVRDVKQIVNLTRYERVKIVNQFKIPTSVSYNIVVRDQGNLPDQKKTIGKNLGKGLGNGLGKGPGQIIGSLHGEIALSDQPLPASQSALPRKPGEGLLIVCADTGPTSDPGFAAGPVDASEHFVRNLIHAFSGRPGGFLAYSGPLIINAQTFTSANTETPPYALRFEQAVEHNGRRFEGLSFPGMLRFYGAVFILAGTNVNWNELKDYLAHGGQVYLTVPGKLSADDWKVVNGFLAPYGLNAVAGPHLDKPIVESGFANSSLFEGVSGLLIKEPSNLKILSGSWPNTQLISSHEGIGYIAAVRVPIAP